MIDMEIVDRTENKILNRVEISFKWQHIGKATPSRKDVMNLVKTLEPGSNPELIIVKDCNTRFGQPLTTGLAFIYSSEDAMKVEPDYIFKRHESLRTGSSSTKKAVEAKVEEVVVEVAEEGGDE
jgi:ribosomal protein S24E